jgi:hypothetical protein
VFLPLLLLLGSNDRNAERTCFQTADPYSDRVNLGADVAIVYGFGKNLQERVDGWRAHGFGVQLMTGVAWGNYQDYLYGRWDGTNHEDEAQTRKSGEKIGHGGDVFYMSPGTNYGKYLCVGVQKALDAGVDAIHLEEPEFWASAGYGAGFKREWQSYYGAPWEAPDSSVDARWKTSKLMYFLYRRALQQVFDYVAAYDKANHKQVRCYVPTHSLLNYASWHIVSPESSLAKLDGCDGYIAQVWTGTARTPNDYRGVHQSRTFETAFLEYGAMQNLVRATGRRVWYLADPVEDNPNHDWADYKSNYESTLVASLLQPDVWRYEVMPWPNRVLMGKYPVPGNPAKKTTIPEGYATELQIVIHALNEMNQPKVEWECGTQGLGVVVSDSLMFERGDPTPSDPDLNQIYGLAMPFVKRGMPIEPVQLENVTLPNYLARYKCLLMTYEGMKPLNAEVHKALAEWVRRGGRLLFVDDDSDPYAKVREWWNAAPLNFATPRLDLFAKLGIADREGYQTVGAGGVYFLRKSPTAIAHDPNGDERLVTIMRAYGGQEYDETSSFILHRGPYVVAAGLTEGSDKETPLPGRYVDLFDPTLTVRSNPIIEPGSRHLYYDLDRIPKGHTLLACAGSMSHETGSRQNWSAKFQGIADSPCILLLRIPHPPRGVTLDGAKFTNFSYEDSTHLFWAKFPGSAAGHELALDLRPIPVPKPEKPNKPPVSSTGSQTQKPPGQAQSGSGR